MNYYYRYEGSVINIKGYFRINILILFVLTIFMNFTIIVSAEESLGIDKWLIESELLNNGDLVIVEDITFRFNEKFNGVFREIVLDKTSGIEAIKVVENSKDKVIEYVKVEKAKKGDTNVFLVNEKKKNIQIQIFSPSKKEEKTFRITYTVKNVAKKYNDIGELYYKFLGMENETPIDFLSVNIILPGVDINNKVKAFAHGPLNGKIHSATENIINLQVKSVPKNTFVEGRILFPREFISNSNNIVDKDSYSSIINEEARFQNRIEENKAKKEAMGVLFGNIAVILATIGILVFVLLIIKYRREKDIHEERKYVEVPDDCSPAVASYITSTYINSNVIIATILDLYRKGYIKIDDGEEFKKKKEVLKDFTITKVKEEDDNLTSHERYFISWLLDDIGDGETVTTNDISNYSKGNSSMFSKHYLKWQQIIKEDAIAKGYFDESSKKYGWPLIILFFVSLVISIVTLVYENLLGLALFGTAFLMLIQGIVLLSRKSNYGYDQYRKWMEFKKYMKNLKKDDSVGNLGKYPKDISLIYSLALGIDKDILNRFNVEDMHTGNLSNYGYGWMYWYFILNNDKNNIFNKSINNSFSSVAPPSGGGGGFSGGGGGGAGGGGAGGF